jgi:hypothetical protein
MDVRWPHRLLSRVPTRSGAIELATEVREAFARQLERPMDLAAACRAGRFRIRQRTLCARRGGHEALLLPEQRNAFQIWVDPTPVDGWGERPHAAQQETARHRFRFRVAHEIAHSFFFRREGGIPRRVVPDSPRQEAFCDQFASALLVPYAVAASCPTEPNAVLRLRESYDVSLQVAVRAVCDAQRGTTAGILYWTYDHCGQVRFGIQWTNAPVTSAAFARTAAVAEAHASQEGGRWIRVPDRRQFLWLSAH